MQPNVLVKKIKIDPNDIKSFKSRFLIVSGKNALEFVRPLMTKYPALFTRVFVFQAKGYSSSDQTMNDNVEISYLDHPIPTINNFKATKKFLDTLIMQQETCYFHFIITGGTSSCIVYPETAINVDQYIQTIEILLMENIDIFTLNQIRSTIDATKGGKLSQILKNHRIHSDILSDILTNNPSYVGSGPTIPGIILSKRSLNRLTQIADNLSFTNLIPNLEKKLLETSIQQSKNHSWSILSSNIDFCNIFQKSIERSCSNFDTYVMDTRVNQEGKLFAEYLFQEFKDLNSSSIYIWAGELRSSIDYQLVKDEEGGRLSLFAYYAAMNFSDTVGVNIIAFATDGKDGSSTQSFYHINGRTYENLLNIPNVNLFLQRYNMGTLLKHINCSLETKYTNINYADIIVLIKY